MDNISFVKTDDNTHINIKAIKWVKEMDECMQICMKSNGCLSMDTHVICRKNNLKNYNKLYFWVHL
jgi:hypothetical protein